MPSSKELSKAPRMYCSLISLSSILSLLLICSTMMSAQGTGGRILGRVADSSGAVLAGVKVTLTNEATGVSIDTTANANGEYNFPQVAVGAYRMQFDLAGFKTNLQRGINVDLNQIVTINSVLQVGTTKETVEVSSEEPLVDTTSTQLGAVMDARQVSTLPLNTRDTYQLLQLQPGVMSTVGSSNTLIYGSDSPGAVSVNGGRGRSNNFSVNGGDANDLFANLPTVQPSPDSIAEFRVLTNTFDAEYGRNSGSVVNVVTKSGTNQWHGNLFEFFRNKVLNANDYCLTAAEGLNCEKPQFNQNQFGGTFGGPIVKSRTFFFASYEGRRIRQGIVSPAVTVPSSQERPSPTNLVNGQIVSDFTDVNPQGTFTGVLNNSALLTSRTGCQAANYAVNGSTATIQDGAPYGAVIPGNPLPPIFPNSQIPLACMDPTAVDLLQFVPIPPNDGSLISTVPTEPIRGDQVTARIDHRLNDKQNLMFYYYFNDDRTHNPFANFELAGADLPGFGDIVAERFQMWNISHNWTINNNTVNEFRFNYNREGQLTFQHPANTELVQNSCPPPPAWLTASVPCFYGDNSTDPLGSQFGIHPFLNASREGLPFISISGGFSLGNDWEGELPQAGNSFQWADSLTKIRGNHTFKFGADVRRQQFNQFYYYNVNGEFSYFGGGPNDTGAANLYPNFLLGLPDTFGQGSAQNEQIRNTGVYVYAEDSWKVRPNLTLNYGLRWELNTPLADRAQHVETFRPGQSSTIFPCGGPNTDCTSQAAIGLVVPGDPGVPAGMTTTYYKAFAPRIGIAWSPGSSGKTSIRAGWGLFYNPIEELVLAQFGAEPPFGGSTTVSETQFNLPFLGQDGATTYLNPFNGVITPQRGTSQDWARFEPIDLFGDFQPHLRSQYTAQYNLTIQRELARDLKMEIGYVGSQGHRLLATHDINYSNPQTCLDIDAILGGLPCAQFGEDSSFFIPAGTVLSVPLHLPYAQNHSVIPAGTTIGPNGITLVGLRPYSSPQCDPLSGNGCPVSGIPVFTGIFAQDTIAGSGYNSFQASLDKRFSRGLQFTAAYTYSKSIDQASSFEGILNPLPGANNYARSLFDARHRFVVSYEWELPIRKYDGLTGKLVNGWSVSGITTYQTGFPIRITSSSDNELMNSFDFELPGEPNQVAPFHWQRPQSNGNYYFNTPASQTSIFSEANVFGYIGSAPRTICCGPGISQTDIAVVKLLPLSERTHIEFRGELFNLFNHTQFYNPDGNSTDGTQFGQVTQVKDPRLAQFALKLYF
ncbi:MAG TPA: carboxypeptidase regulatory-like domain-containing protein [Terriglobales bacterium]|jgi:outer membrane receptor protein involved in Fe transport|nr:carboxypeptidase regulatory-like domain-containing protein [Terriglobales bacterium]